ncbi:MAG: Na/Pi cotransporter family protein [Pseudomonadota bacterium]
MESFSWSILLGGVAFFFLGLRLARQELQLVAGDRLRRALAIVSDNRFKAFGLGAIVTFLFQSSSATSVLLVGLADTGLINVYQAISILLGADFSTTLVVILLSIKKITEMSLGVIALGFLLQVITKHRKVKTIGAIVLSYGFIFFGMHLMISAAEPLKNSPLALEIFAYLGANPVASLVLATMVAGVVNSAGMIGIAIALAFAGAITFQDAVPLVLGANLGTCVTVLLAAISAQAEGRQIAIAHTLSKFIGVVIAMPLIPYIVQVVDVIANFLSGFSESVIPSIPGKIVLTHILFNLGLAVLLLPFVGLLARFIKYVGPIPKKKKEFKPKYLDKTALETPALAFAQVKREILRMAEIAHQMFGNCLLMFSKGSNSAEEIEKLQAEDDKIDILDKAVRFYLAELASEKFSPEQAKAHIQLLCITTDIEQIGDIISRELVLLAKKKATKAGIFSAEGWKDLKGFQDTVSQNFALAVSILAQPSEELAAKVYRQDKAIDEIEQQLRQAHLNRLHHGLKESFDTSSIHLDILGNLRRINDKCSHIVQMIMSGLEHPVEKESF